MPEHTIGTHQEWQAARGELAKLESEHAERNEEIKRKRLDSSSIARRRDASASFAKLRPAVSKRSSVSACSLPFATAMVNSVIA